MSVESRQEMRRVTSSGFTVMPWLRRRSERGSFTTAECVLVAPAISTMSESEPDFVGSAPSDLDEQHPIPAETVSVDLERSTMTDLTHDSVSESGSGSVKSATGDVELGPISSPNEPPSSEPAETVVQGQAIPANSRGDLASTDKRGFCNRKIALLLLIVVGIVAGAIIAAVLVTSDRSGSNGGETPSSTGATSNPEADKYFQQVRAELVSPSVWTDSSSPQMRAVEWMAYTDTSVRLLDDLPRLTQRYALLVVYFATGGENWDAVEQFPPGVHECEWIFITCNDADMISRLEIAAGFVSGILPSEIGLLSQLTVLDLQNNRMKGSLPDELYDLSQLKSLILSSNLFSSSLSTKIGNLLALETLHLDSNFFTGTIPTTLSQLTLLKEIDCTDSFFHGPIFDRLLPALTNLEVFEFTTTMVSGTFPNDINALSKLRVLDIMRTQISGTLPESITTLPLERLYTFDSSMDGGFPESIGSLAPTLEVAVLGRFMSSTLPTALGLLTKLETLFLSSNLFEGSIPTQMGNMRNLSNLILDYNSLTGTIPPELGKLTKLIRLNLKGNKLTGSVSSEVCNLTTSPDFLELIVNTDCDFIEIACSCCKCATGSPLDGVGE